MIFRVHNYGKIEVTPGKSIAYLKPDNWDDFGYNTAFILVVYDEKGKFHDLGPIKIGFIGQTKKITTFSKLDPEFESLSDEFFSLGQSTEFYKSVALMGELGLSVLSELKDIVVHPEIIEGIKDQPVFSISLLRNHSLSTIKGQFSRLLAGEHELTNYNFNFEIEGEEKFGGFSLDFNVIVGSKPTSNIHAVIGRNGVGKTTLLNSMIGAITKSEQNTGQFYELTTWLFGNQKKIDTDYFSSLVSVSFSAFDPFSPPLEQSDPAQGTCYFYIGLKDVKDAERHKSIPELQKECVWALARCFESKDKTNRWRKAIEKLGSDENFASMSLERLETSFIEVRQQITSQSDSQNFLEYYLKTVKPFLDKMSSGHAIVLLTITRLVATVEEKTLVLLDEPESHLHPPLLSAFVRALSDLLLEMNGVAIIATHSPVVLQEIPKCCVWKMYRRGIDMQCDRPKIETFAENVGVLTTEVFSLEVERSGFHAELKNSVVSGKSYQDILNEYEYKIGFEGRAILKAMIADRDKDKSHDEPI
ncbi:AAA family ATPase [Methylophaga sp.]|uniref:AAA family ATPase n=1 Tax=Methylophaga sp. TaxID=2024840 RepID=UPI003F70A49E